MHDALHTHRKKHTHLIITIRP